MSQISNSNTPQNLEWQNALQLARVLRLGQNLLDDAQQIDHLESLLRYQFARWFEEPLAKAHRAEEPQDEKVRLKLKLKQLVQAEAPWDQIEEIAFFLFDQHPSQENATRLLEYSFLFGNLDASLGVLKRTQENNIHFYHRVHPSIRNKLLQAIWKDAKDPWLLARLLLNREEGDLGDATPDELLYLFLYQSEKEISNQGYLFFRRYRNQIFEGHARLGSLLQISASRIYSNAAKLAAQIGFHEEAIELAQEIEAGSLEHHAALNLILTSSKQLENFSRSEIASLWENHPEWQDRLELIENTLKKARESGDYLGADEINFNIICENLLEHFPKEPEIWGQLSQLIVSNIDLVSKIPKLIRLFAKRICVLEEAPRDHALWEPFLVDYDHPLTKNWGYFIACAQLHRFLHEGIDEGIQRLWLARELILDCEYQLDPQSGYYSWAHLLNWAQKSIKTLGLSEKISEKMQIALKVCAREPSIADIEGFVGHKLKAPLVAFKTFQLLLQREDSSDLELHLLMALGELAPYTNADLSRLWDISVSREDADLAWRVATLQKQRQVLESKVERAWQICGENRRVYPYRIPEGADIDCCLQGFRSNQVHIIWAMLKLSTHLVELLALKDSSIKLRRRFSLRLKLREIDPLETCFEQSKWFGPIKRDYEITNDRFDTQIIFAQSVSTGNWAQVLIRLCHRMALRSWSWDLKQLNQSLHEYRIHTRDDKSRAPLNRWLAGLAVEQKNAWHDFLGLVNKVDAEETQQAIFKFVCRLSTVIYPHHDLALSSMIKMQAPLWLYRDLEAFILSEPYSRLRNSLGFAHNVSVPQFLIPGVLPGRSPTKAGPQP